MSEINYLICDRCKKEITVPAYIRVQASIMLQQNVSPAPMIFTCKEHAENYAKTMILHDDCWIAELTDHGVPLHDMVEVRKRYNENAARKNAAQSDIKVKEES